MWLYESDPCFSSPESPLLKEIRNGAFQPQTPEGCVRELKMLIEKLNRLSTFVACDHENNYVHVSGILKESKERMLAIIDNFLTLPETKRDAHYLAVGSRI
ncbi:MAG: hypothetical protein MRK01_02755 [Candidatus Scalindua sp.]|nr:hypothetical protein [Candidatus Scalindua sp.]